MGTQSSGSEPRLASAPIPFELLQIDPSASCDAVRAACSRLQQLGTIEKSVLDHILSELLDPEARLPHELGFPLDATPAQVEAISLALRAEQEDNAVLTLARALPPLSAANFLAASAARRPLTDTSIVAWLDAHESIDTASIFERFRSIRYSAGLPAPSFVSLTQALDHLLKVHAERILDGYEPLHSVPAPLANCIRAIAPTGKSFHLRAIDELVDVYRRRTAPLLEALDRELDSVCRQLKATPESGEAIEKLKDDLETWVRLSSLLVPTKAHGGASLDHLSELLLTLSSEKRHSAAKTIIETILPGLSPIPELRSQYEAVAALINQMLFEKSLDDLEAMLTRFGEEPQALVQAINQTGSDEGARGDVEELWNSFLNAASHNSRSFDDRPWMLIDSFAGGLAIRTDGLPAARSLMRALVTEAERLDVPPPTLETIRETLRRLSHDPADRLGRASIAPRRRWFAILLTLPVAIVVGALILAKINLSSVGRNPVPAAPDAMPETELLPPIARGQRFKREYVRYCHFQEERLRVIKEHVQGPDDARAYNTLAADYNARCSDFYYQDRDLDAIKEEVKTNRATLAADAARIMSTWPWRRSASLSN